MGELFNIGFTLILSYIAGSIPFGLLFVWIFTGKDVRMVESGRTGGTNAMRAAGFIAGALTAAGDTLKGVATGWIAGWLAPDYPWVRVIAALLAILGHNYSVFLMEKRTIGGIRLRGGAGGATALGGAIALWPYAGFIIFPLAGLVYIFVGYASVTTMSVAFFSILVFAIRAGIGLSPWLYVAYGFGALAVVIWALRPNLQRLREGTERVVGLRAFLKRRQQQNTRQNKRPSPQRYRQENHI
jgi:glycerol-3-phosphate acyltransferase PlsY